MGLATRSWLSGGDVGDTTFQRQIIPHDSDSFFQKNHYQGSTGQSPVAIKNIPAE